MHADGCHWFTFSYRCACGATYNSTDERDIASDPWSGVWMEPVEGDECERCSALMNGATPMHSYAVISRDGTVERSSDGG